MISHGQKAKLDELDSVRQNDDLVDMMERKQEPSD